MIGEEALMQMEMASEYPDFVTLAPRLRAQRASAGVGCAGGGTLRDFAVVDAGFCAMMRAWLTHACVMTGAGKIYVVERECRSNGAEACVFEGSW